MSYTISYNGMSAQDIGLLTVQRPDIPAPQLRIEEKTIKGRDGNLIITDGCYEDIYVTIQLNYMSKPTQWKETFRKAKSWLLARSGNRMLKLSDDADYFYKVKNVIVGENERSSLRVGIITPTFLCEPFEYLEAGLNAYHPEEVFFNPYYVSKPIYKITGEGICTLTVNGKAITANVVQNLTINTDLMISYRDDGRMQNTAVAGNYEDIFLQEGENQIDITEGFDLKVIPNWRCL